MRGKGRPSLSTPTEGVNLGVPLTFLFLVLVSRLRVWVKLWRLEMTGRRREAGNCRRIFASVDFAGPGTSEPRELRDARVLLFLCKYHFRQDTFFFAVQLRRGAASKPSRAREGVDFGLPPNRLRPSVC